MKRYLRAMPVLLAPTLMAGAAGATQTAPVSGPTDGDVVVAIGSFTPRGADEIGAAVSVVDAEILNARQTILISDVLRTVPGLAVNRSGPQGALTQVRIRGAEANQTLVFIDGVEANNPVSSEFNFATLLSSEVERAEVIRGAQSALYGSEAIGGVISIVTRDPGEGLDGDMELEAGAFGTRRGYAGVGVGTARFGVRGALETYRTDGISQSPTGTEEDGFEAITASLKAVYRPTAETRIEGSARAVDARVESDAQEFVTGTVQDSADVADTSDLFAKISATTTLLNGAITPFVAIGYTEATARNHAGTAETGRSRGERLDVTARVTGRLGTGAIAHGATFGVEREEFDFDNGINQAADEQTSLVAEYTADIAQRLFVSGAVRQDFNEVFDDATTYRVTAAYLIDATGTRLHASAGEGITDPTFTERFGFDPSSFIGNPDLTPERATSWDVGFTQDVLEARGRIDVTYFEATLEDEITTRFSFDPDVGGFVSTPFNQTGESDRSGVEVTLEADLGAGFSAMGSYTHLDATDPDGAIEVRRPGNIASANVTWASADERATVHLGVDHNGEHEDSFFVFPDPLGTGRRTLDSYTLVRLAGSYRLSDTVALFVRGENLADADYQEVLGFASPGVGVYGGVRISASRR